MHDQGQLSEPPRVISIRGRSLDQELTGRVITESTSTGDPCAVDLTIIATQTARHVADAQYFGGFTERLLVEKPIATSLAQASELADLARRVPMAVCAPLRFLDAFTAVKATLPGLGALRSVRVRCQSWLPDWRPGTDFRASYSADPQQGGVLRDLVHEIDVAITLFGMPQAVTAELASDPELDIPVETSAHMTWHYEGYDLTMVLDYVSRVPTRGLIAEGAYGHLTWDLLAGRVDVDNPVSTDRAFPGDLDRDAVLQAQVEAAAAPAGSAGANACARLADGMRALAIVEFAKASAAAGGQRVAVSITRSAS